MKTQHVRAIDIIRGKTDVPIGLKDLCENVGVSYYAIDAITWTRQADGQLVSMTMHFNPQTIDPLTLQKTVDDLELTVRLTNILRAEGITTVGELLKLSAVEVKKIPNLGKKQFSELVDALNIINVSLRA